MTKASRSQKRVSTYDLTFCCSLSFPSSVPSLVESDSRSILRGHPQPLHCPCRRCRVVTGDADDKIKQPLSSVPFSAPFAQACGPTAPPDTHGGTAVDPRLPAGSHRPEGLRPLPSRGSGQKEPQQYHISKATAFLMYHLFFLLISVSLHFL